MELSEKQQELLAQFLVISNIGKLEDQKLTTPREIQIAYAKWDYEYSNVFGEGLKHDLKDFLKRIKEGEFVNRVQEEIPFILDNFKPPVKLLGEDGNVFSIIAKVSKTLERAGLKDKAEEFKKKATSSGSYDQVLALLFDYVEVQ